MARLSEPHDIVVLEINAVPLFVEILESVILTEGDICLVDLEALSDHALTELFVVIFLVHGRNDRVSRGLKAKSPVEALPNNHVYAFQHRWHWRLLRVRVSIGMSAVETERAAWMGERC